MQLALEYVVRQVAAMTTQSVQSGSAFPIVSGVPAEYSSTFSNKPNFKYFLQDKFDNLTGETLKGKVVVKVTTPSDGIDEIPALAGNVYSMEVPLVKGVATVQNLLIQENTAGKDGQEYLLNFHTQIPANASPHPIPPFTLAFLFYNGMARLCSSFSDNLFVGALSKFVTYHVMYMICQVCNSLHQSYTCFCHL